ncbi:hypothetical protein Tco_0017637 [Tanacetum coccineum]
MDIPKFKISLYNAKGLRGYNLPTSNTLGDMVFENGITTNKEFDVMIGHKDGFYTEMKLRSADGSGTAKRVMMLADEVYTFSESFNPLNHAFMPKIGDKNPLRTLGDYSKPSHEGYRNTIELLVGNNMCEIYHAAAGKLRNKNTHESWEIIKNLALYDHEGWDETNEFVKPVKAIDTPQGIPKTPD